MAELKKFTLRPVSLLIALAGPLLWVIDSLVGSRQQNASFTRQLFSPGPAELWFRIWFVFLTSLLAFFAGRTSRRSGNFSPLEEAQDTRLEPVVQQSSIVEEPPQAITAGTAGQTSRQEEVQRQELDNKLEQATKSLEQKYAREFEEKIGRERRQMEAAIRLEEKKTREVQIQDLKSEFAQELAEKLAQERSKVEEAVRQEEQKKLAEQLRQIESKRQTLTSVELAEERSRFEEAVRKEERVKAAEAEAKLKQQYDELMRAQLEEERMRIEEQFMHDAEAKAAAKIQVMEDKHAQDIAERIARERKAIEESVRQEEQQKAQEAESGLKQKYDEAKKSELQEERRRAEEAAQQAHEQKLADAMAVIEQKHAQAIEEARQEEKKQAEESARALEQKLTQQLQARIAEERQTIGEAARREAEKGVEDEKKISAETARQEERKKAADAVKALEKKHAEALAEAAKKVEEQALAKAKELKSLDMAKLVKGLSQQVMNPLSAVINNVKVMNIKLANQQDFKVSDIKDAVSAIEENASLARSILTSLSEISGQASGSFAALSLNDLVAKIDTLYGKELKLQSISIQKVLQANLPLVSADPTLLFLIMFNMVANAKWAIKKNAYGTGGGTITIKTQKSAQEGFVELIVADDGVGIIKQDLKRVFEPFFTTKKEGEGLGLGLTIVSEIVKAHKGQIQVDTSPGGGAVFTVLLPAIPEERAA